MPLTPSELSRLLQDKSATKHSKVLVDVQGLQFQVEGIEGNLLRTLDRKANLYPVSHSDILDELNRAYMNHDIAVFKGKSIPAQRYKGRIEALSWFLSHAGLEIRKRRRIVNTYQGVYEVTVCYIRGEEEDAKKEGREQQKSS